MTMKARPPFRYRITSGVDSVEVPARLARAFWDVHPDDLRTGDRERAFILWSCDNLGRRGTPVLFRPVLAGEEYGAAA